MVRRRGCNNFGSSITGPDIVCPARPVSGPPCSYQTMRLAKIARLLGGCSANSLKLHGDRFEVAFSWPGWSNCLAMSNDH